MKKIKLNTAKLKLGKSTISSLSDPEMNNVWGGVTGPTNQCVTTNNCLTYDGCTFSGSPCVSPSDPRICPAPSAGCPTTKPGEFHSLFGMGC